MKILPVLCLLLAAAGTPRANAADKLPPPSPAARAVTPVYNKAPHFLATNGPRIVFTNTSVDCGKVISGAIFRHDFAFSNSGTAALEIMHAESDCACTTVEHYSRRVEPGQTGTVSVKVDSQNGTGPLARGIRVYCNDPERPFVLLQVKATLWKPVEVDPALLHFSFHTGDDLKTSRSIRIAGKTGKPLVLSNPQSSHKAFEAEIRPVIQDEQYELVARTTGLIGPGKTEGVITVETSCAELPVIRIKVTADRKENVTVNPAAVTLPAGALTRETVERIYVHNHLPTGIKLGNPRASRPAVPVELTEISPGRLFCLAAHFPKGFQLKADEKLELTVTTTDAHFPELRIPVRQ